MEAFVFLVVNSMKRKKEEIQSQEEFNKLLEERIKEYEKNTPLGFV